jgi:hypothetical protein
VTVFRRSPTCGYENKALRAIIVRMIILLSNELVFTKNVAFDDFFA